MSARPLAVQAVWQVTMRLAAPGAAASMALVGLGITNELTATLMLAPNGTRTLATEFWSLTSELDYAAAAPYALLMVLLSLPLTVAAARAVRPGRRAMSFLSLQRRQPSATASSRRSTASISTCRPASRTAIVGPSGSGKTTLLRLIAGFEAPDAGSIVLDGAVAGRRRRVAVPAAPPRHRLRGAGRRAVPASERRRQYRLRARPTDPGRDARDRASCIDAVELARTMRDRRPHRALGRPAAARRAGPGAGPAAAADAARRAVLGARCRPAREHAQVGEPAAGRRRHHRHPGHPRSGGGAVLRRPAGGDAGRPAGAGRPAAGALPDARGTATRRVPRRGHPPAGRAVRRRLGHLPAGPGRDRHRRPARPGPTYAAAGATAARADCTRRGRCHLPRAGDRGGIWRCGLDGDRGPVRHRVPWPCRRC